MVKPICIRLPPEMETITREIVAAQSITLSEWVRMLIYNAIYGNTPDVNEGYMQARTLALKLATEMLRRANEMLPQNYDEAVSYFGLAGPGRPPGT